MIRYSYRWVLARIKNNYAAHLCHVEIVDGGPTYFTPLHDVRTFRRAMYEANSKDLIKQDANGALRILKNQRKALAQCGMCGGIMTRQESVKGGNHTGCGRLQTVRSGNAKQGDRPFKRGVIE